VRYPLIWAALLLAALPSLGEGEAVKRVAVLYFEDHSHFDSPLGCGCIPDWKIFRLLFGTRSREYWDLKWGFRKMLNEHLDASGVYRSVSPREIEEACKKLGIKKLKDLSKKKELRAKLADELDLDAMIIGDVLRFSQERLRGKMGGGGIAGHPGTAYLMRMGAAGYFYIASVGLKIRVFDRSGEELSTFRVGKRATYSKGSIKTGLFQTIITDLGVETRIGRKPVKKLEKEPPIVEPYRLDMIKFASPEYHKTLFGQATDAALEEVVLRLRELIGPPLPAETPGSKAIRGKVIHVSPDGTVFINLGSDAGVWVGMRLEVVKPVKLTDPDTGEVLGETFERAGEVQIIEVLSPRLSKGRLTEGQAERGDLVRTPSR